MMSYRLCRSEEVLGGIGPPIAVVADVVEDVAELVEEVALAVLLERKGIKYARVFSSLRRANFAMTPPSGLKDAGLGVERRSDARTDPGSRPRPRPTSIAARIPRPGIFAPACSAGRI